MVTNIQSLFSLKLHARAPREAHRSSPTTWLMSLCVKQSLLFLHSRCHGSSSQLGAEPLVRAAPGDPEVRHCHASRRHHVFSVYSPRVFRNVSRCIRDRHPFTLHAGDCEGECNRISLAARLARLRLNGGRMLVKALWLLGAGFWERTREEGRGMISSQQPGETGSKFGTAGEERETVLFRGDVGLQKEGQSHCLTMCSLPLLVPSYFKLLPLFCCPAV